MGKILGTAEARQGDTVDMICQRFYGATGGYVEAVLDTNPGLAALGVVLPMGTRIEMPDIDPVPSEIQLVALWD
jgi:phage tail protein X